MFISFDFKSLLSLISIIYRLDVLSHFLLSSLSQDISPMFLNQSLSPELPKIFPMADLFEVFEGEPFQQSCILASSKPAPIISWSKDGLPLNPNSPSVVISSPTASMSLLIISEVKRSHSGEYSCLATNQAGTSSRTVLLKVKGQLKIQYQKSLFGPVLGLTVSLVKS